MHLGPANTEVAQLKVACRLCQQQDLHEHVFDLSPKRLAKVRQFVVVWVQPTRHKAQGQAFVSRLLELG